jgi:hypothetical protein
MGSSVSTLVGWTVVIGCVYIFGFGLPGKKAARDAVRAASPRQRLEGGQNNRKDVKDKAKRQRVEAIKTAQLKAPAPAPKPSAPSQPVDYSSDDGVDNREFARQLASIKQGTALNATKKSDEKRQKSVKQSRAQVIDDVASEKKVISVPSSNAGADADDDESSAASPEVKAVDASGVSDMLEPKASGPSVLRLTDTDKAKPKEKKAKVPEKVETEKQRQNRLKAEAAKADREEAEKQRKVDMEAQRRTARIAEGRAAKDGSTFVAAQAKPSVWTGNGADASPSSNATNGEFVPVQPLDTFDTGSYTDVSVPKSATPAKNKATETWMTSLPSEEEQMEILRGEDAWNTVTKKTNKKKKDATAESPIDSEPTVIQSQPIAKPRATSNGTGPTTTKQAKAFSQQSSFAALSPSDEPEVEEQEWDV